MRHGRYARAVRRRARLRPHACGDSLARACGRALRAGLGSRAHRPQDLLLGRRVALRDGHHGQREDRRRRRPSREDRRARRGRTEARRGVRGRGRGLRPHHLRARGSDDARSRLGRRRGEGRAAHEALPGNASAHGAWVRSRCADHHGGVRLHRRDPNRRGACRPRAHLSRAGLRAARAELPRHPAERLEQGERAADRRARAWNRPQRDRLFRRLRE